MLSNYCALTRPSSSNVGAAAPKRQRRFQPEEVEGERAVAVVDGRQVRCVLQVSKASEYPAGFESDGSLDDADKADALHLCQHELGDMKLPQDAFSDRLLLVQMHIRGAAMLAEPLELSSLVGGKTKLSPSDSDAVLTAATVDGVSVRSTLG
eukprot:2585065-Alexandrium_andersonii.AAC.1